MMEITRNKEWILGDLRYTASHWARHDGEITYRGVVFRQYLLPTSTPQDSQPCRHRHRTMQEAHECAEGMLIDALVLGWEIWQKGWEE